MHARAPKLRELPPSPRHGVAGIVRKMFYLTDFLESGLYTMTTVCCGMDSGSEQ